MTHTSDVGEGSRPDDSLSPDACEDTSNSSDTAAHCCSLRTP
eukprot:CAMPEP_0197440224 /NCGR_PEP_ID=MMETSP1175-20131217/6784_1 /TAXON_ID=1003142 /ORGANISM="Triceratium dubium, Strain CCMP147" /LENGTH=41 /DNA_ID= /DNA_START= /DNA_END= /DNA_ORIENTATION=